MDTEAGTWWIVLEPWGRGFEVSDGPDGQSHLSPSLLERPLTPLYPLLPHSLGWVQVVASPCFVLQRREGKRIHFHGETPILWEWDPDQGGQTPVYFFSLFQLPFLFAFFQPISNDPTLSLSFVTSAKGPSTVSFPTGWSREGKEKAGTNVPKSPQRLRGGVWLLQNTDRHLKKPILVVNVFAFFKGGEDRSDLKWDTLCQDLGHTVNVLEKLSWPSPGLASPSWPGLGIPPWRESPPWSYPWACCQDPLLSSQARPWPFCSCCSNTPAAASPKWRRCPLRWLWPPPSDPPPRSSHTLWGGECGEKKRNHPERKTQDTGDEEGKNEGCSAFNTHMPAMVRHPLPPFNTFITTSKLWCSWVEALQSDSPGFKSQPWYSLAVKAVECVFNPQNLCFLIYKMGVRPHSTHMAVKRMVWKALASIWYSA